ncbi:MAG: YraN family protein [candidate division Zixibacteria bacterium]|nr:YraN family protein [candidate division Zixibacteria bacterium]
MHKIGKLGENLAADFLANKGYKILKRNWRGIKGFRCPEIDIIAKDNKTVIFIEVKAVSTDRFGAPEYKVTLKKQKRLANGAKAYLSQYCDDNTECRFDVITVDFMSKPSVINHIENAFSVSD